MNPVNLPWMHRTLPQDRSQYRLFKSWFIRFFPWDPNWIPELFLSSGRRHRTFQVEYMGQTLPLHFVSAYKSKDYWTRFGWFFHVKSKWLKLNVKFYGLKKDLLINIQNIYRNMMYLFLSDIGHLRSISFIYLIQFVLIWVQSFLGKSFCSDPKGW